MSDCDCPDCTAHRSRLARAWHWLESEPGPWLSVLPWGLLALGMITYLVW